MGSTAATRRYKVRLYAINTHGVTGWRSQILDGRLLHNGWTDFDSVFWRLLGSTSATRQYKVRLDRIKTQEIAVFFGRGLEFLGGFLLDS